MTYRTIGIDLAIRGDHVAQIFDEGRPCGRPIRFRHDPASLTSFVLRAREKLEEGDRVQAIMEPTGMSWFPIAHQLIDAGVDVARVKGKRVKALRRYLSEHTKTDIADAQILAAIPGFGGPRLDPVHIPTARSHALQRLTKQRSRFQDDISAAKRRLIDLIRWASPALEAVLPDLATHLSLALLRRWLDPAAALSARKATLRKFVAEHASGNHPRSGLFVETLIDGLRLGLSPFKWRGICSARHGSFELCWCGRARNGAGRGCRSRRYSAQWPARPARGCRRPPARQARI